MFKLVQFVISNRIDPAFSGWFFNYQIVPFCYNYRFLQGVIMLEVCTYSEIAMYVLYLILICYWLRSLSRYLLEYDPTRSWSENAFIEICLLFLHNIFYRVPYLLPPVLDSFEIDSSIYLMSYWVFLVFSLVVLLFFLHIGLKTKQNANQLDNHGICKEFQKQQNQIMVAENTSNNFFQHLQEYWSVESALLDVIIILSILSSTLNLLCERVLTGFLYSLPNLLYITHLGFLVKKKLFSTDVTYFYWLGYVSIALLIWIITKAFYTCTLRQLLLELYSNVSIIFFTTTIAACRKFDGTFSKDILFLGKFLALLSIICLMNTLPVYKRTFVVLLIE